MSELQRRRRRLRVRWLVAFTCLVVMVDLAAGVLTIVADHRADESRSRVTAGLDYVTNTGNLMQAVLEAESDVRGYVLTGERAYLNVSTTVKTAPTLVKRIKRDSGGDPVLRADYRKLAPLLTARVNDLVATLRPAMKGDYAAAVAVVKTNRGKQITAQIRALTQAMVARSNQLVNRERASSQNSQVLAGYASIVAYGASGLLLVMMALLLRGYMQADQERRASMRAQVEAERLSSAKTGFLSRVSHELRTPLNAILGFGQLLEREPLDASQRETLDQMLSGGRHLLAIVDDLLDLSRVESNELRLSVEPVQVAEAVQEARALMAHTASAAAVGLRQRAIDDTLFVQADNQRLMQILLNLISNAVKYNRRGGNVVVGASRTPEGMVRVEVADTGYGIAAADIPQLFRPFERLDAARRGIE
ncbi:MAG TPA: histidine kinase dimerization/phospho-acceptor domain-containing protein, partial [Solirubrobacteraceae bacterium]|nr:histidine kinase dimerization/phospho-acceptor domain-containing protein [Solirubrobacteraceae bacterium]